MEDEKINSAQTVGHRATWETGKQIENGQLFSSSIPDISRSNNVVIFENKQN